MRVPHRPELAATVHVETQVPDATKFLRIVAVEKFVLAAGLDMGSLSVIKDNLDPAPERCTKLKVSQSGIGCPPKSGPISMRKTEVDYGP